MKRIFTPLILFLIFYSSSIYAQTPFEKYGALQVLNNQLCNQYGQPVQLRGMSTHGLQYFPGCINSGAMIALRDQWEGDIIRLAMYTEEGGYIGNAAYWKGQIDTLVQSAYDAGIYVIIDWHILSDGDPNTNIAASKDFFQYMSSKHSNKNNVLYEICNEPNGDGNDQGEWDNYIKPYADTIIPIIRKNDPNAIILVGTPKWSGKPAFAANNPLTGSNAFNVMYTFHFYAGSHYTEGYINNIIDRIPIFVSEWGTSAASGNGGNDYTNADKWMALLNGDNKGHKLISWCNWSYSDAGESSAALNSNACSTGSWTNTTTSGTYVMNQMKKDTISVLTGTGKPVIYVQPASDSVLDGSDFTLSVRASGSAVINYAWYFNNAALSNSNNQDLKLTSFSQSQAGNYYVEVSNTAGSVKSNTVSLVDSKGEPYNSVYETIPGKVQMENFDVGPEGVAYHDQDAANQGGAYRNTGVDIKSVTDSGVAGYSVGYIADNEWLKFTVKVTQAGHFRINYRAATSAAGGNIMLMFDDQLATRLFPIPSTGSYSTYETFSADTISLSQGLHTMIVYFDNGGFDLDYIRFDALNIDCNGVENGTASIDSCGVCSGGTTGIMPNSSCKDCAGVINGTASLDHCGVCSGGTTGKTPNATCKDCNGVQGGSAYIDSCGVCAGGNTGKVPNASCTDCAGVVNGTASVDTCGVCSGGTTGIIPDSSCRDCAGVIKGTAAIDSCGVCSGGTTGIVPDSSCKDCAGVINGTAQIDNCGVCGGNDSSCIGIQIPYQDIPQVIPGRIQAEKYDNGGEGIAYHDTDKGNNGGYFRSDDVDIDVSDSGGYVVGWTEPGEWLEYTVNVKYTGQYHYIVKSATPGSGRSLHIQFDSTEVPAHSITLPNSGAYTTYSLLVVDSVNLTKGTHIMRVTFESNEINLDWIEVDANFTVDCNGVPNGTALIDSCGICAGGTTGIQPDTSACGCNCVVTGLLAAAHTNAIVYPNPSNGIFHVTLPDKATSVRIFDAAGKSVQEISIGDATEFTVGENLEPGVYFIQYSTSQTPGQIMIIKK